MKIKSVSLFFPMSEQGEIVNYTVGIGDVTEIIPIWKNGAFCYSIYKKGKFDSELYHYIHVSYEIE